MDKINNWLNRSFPFMGNRAQKVWISFAFATFVYLFLLLFQPFGISDVNKNIYIYLLGFFFITLVVMIFFMILLPYIFPKIFDTEKWIIKKSIILNSSIILIISILNWSYNNQIVDSETLKHTLFQFVLITLAVGVFPSVFMVMIAEMYLKVKHQEIAVAFEDSIKHFNHLQSSKEILIKSDSGQIGISINAKDLICIKAEGNYVKVFNYNINGIMEHQLYRDTLTRIIKESISLENIQRCHRSFIVNFEKVEKVTGNARNYNLHFKDLDFSIPLSRNFPKSIINNMKKV